MSSRVFMVFCLWWLLSSEVAAQRVFPQVKGFTLDEKKVIVPAQNGKFSVVAIAFHRDAEEDLKKWLQPLYDSFITKEEGGSFDLAEFYDVNFVFIPFIAGFKRIAEEFKQNTDEHYWPYIMDTEKTDVKELQNRLGIKDTKTPYFFVLDGRGNIVETVSGRFSSEKMEKLEEAIEL